MAHEVTCRQYGTDAGDYQTVAAWYAHHHHGEPFPAMVLPPHGVIASVDGKPAAALWVYLSFGIGVAHVHWALGRPGAGAWVLGAAFRAAMAWIEDVCRAHDCHVVFATVIPRLGRYLQRCLGYSAPVPHAFSTRVLA